MNNKNKKCGIYKITNIINNKIYIGQSTNIYCRLVKHIWSLDNGKSCNQHLQNAWNKYGKQNFKFEIIMECQKNELNKEEIIFIAKYNSIDKNNGYNIKIGGEYNTSFSTETKKSISERQMGDKNHRYGKKTSEETLKKLSKSLSGENNPNYGKHWSQEIKNKISNSLLGDKNPNYGKKRSKETIEKMRLAMKGRKFSEEHKKKIGAASKGRKYSEESIRKGIETRKRIRMIRDVMDAIEIVRQKIKNKST